MSNTVKSLLVSITVVLVAALGGVLFIEITWLGIVVVCISCFVIYNIIKPLLDSDDRKSVQPTSSEAVSYYSPESRKTHDSSSSSASQEASLYNLFNKSLNVIQNTFTLSKKDARVELACFLVFTCDYYGFTHSLERRKIQAIVMQAMKKALQDDYSAFVSVVDARKDLYSGFTNRIRLPMACINPSADLNKSRPFQLAFYGFCDILLDPSIAVDYDKAPIILLGFDRCISLCAIANDLLINISKSVDNVLSDMNQKK